MQLKTCDLIGSALDWAVAKARGIRVQYDSREGLIISNITGWFPYRPSTAWGLGGPIIEEEKINIKTNPLNDPSFPWYAVIKYDGVHILEDGLTPLVAAMRAYVTLKLGESVEIPEELMHN